MSSDTPAAAALETAVIIVNYRTKELTRDAVASVLSEDEVREVVVVDNGSADGSAEYLRDAFDDERLHVMQSDCNRGFGPAVNLAVPECRAGLLLILNSDATVRPQSLGRLARTLIADDATGVIAPAVYQSDGVTSQPGTYGRLPTRRDFLQSNGWVSTKADDRRLQACPGWISGVAMLFRRADFLALNGFDEEFSMYFEDVDLCRRMWEAGKSVRREGSAAVVHLGGKSWGSKRDKTRRFHESKLRYFQKLGVSRAELLCIRLVGAVRTSLARD